MLDVWQVQGEYVIPHLILVSIWGLKVSHKYMSDFLYLSLFTNASYISNVSLFNTFQTFLDQSPASLPHSGDYALVLFLI